MRRSALVAAAVAVAVPLSAIGLALSRSWTPVSDWALIEAAVRDTGTSRTPLLGFFSRFGWFHPGPWPYYVLALPYRLLGGSPQALLISVALVNAGAVGVCLRACWRIMGHRLVLLGALLLVPFMAGMRAWLLIDPWNPWLALLPFAALVVCCWALALGNRWYLPVSLALGTFVVQCHVAYVVPATAVVVVGLVFAWQSSRGSATRWRPALVVGAAVLTVGWLPVAIEQVTAEQGNVAKLVSFFVTDRDEPAAGIGQASRILATESTGWPPWLGRPEPVRFDPDPRDPSSAPELASPWAALLPAALLVGALLVARRRGSRPLVVGAGLALVLYSSTWLGLVRLGGPQYFWLIRSTWVSGWFTVLVVAAVLVEVVLDSELLARSRVRRNTVAIGAATVVLALGAVAVRTGSGANLPVESLGWTVEALVPSTVAWLRGHGHETVAVAGLPDERSGATHGLYDALSGAGFDASMSGYWAGQVAPGNRDDGEATVTVHVVSGANVDAWRSGGAEEVATFEPNEIGIGYGLMPTSVFVRRPGDSVPGG